MKLLKWAAIGIGLPLAAIFAGVTLYLGQILGTAVERGGSYALGVDTRVGVVRLAPLAGAFRMSSLSIDNPPGFPSERFLELGSGSLDVDMSTIRKPTIVMPRIELDGVDIVLERDARGTNAAAILRNLKRFEKADAAGPAAGQDVRTVVVRELVITDLRASVEVDETLARALGQKALVPLEVPEIRLENVGQGRQLTMAELSNIVMKTILTAVAKRGVGILPNLLLGDMTQNLAGLTRVPGQLTMAAAEGVTGTIGKTIEAVVPGEIGEVGRGVVEGAGRAVGEGAEKALGRVGGLLGRERED